MPVNCGRGRTAAEFSPMVFSSLQHCDGTVTEVTPTGHRAPAGISDLPGAGFVAELPDRLNDVVEPDDVSLRQQTTCCVDAQLAAKFNVAVGHETVGTPALTKTRFLELLEHFEGEAV